MPLNRQFIGWGRPALPAICRRLLEQSVDLNDADLTGCLLVVPSGRARFRILEILIELSENQNLVLAPPSIVTVGELPEHLYQQKKPFANELAQRMAWVRAIQSIDTEKLTSVFHNVPQEPSHPAWTQMADLLARMHRELASDVLMFSNVVEHASKIDGFDEQHRWQILEEIQLAYLATLDDCGLWDRQTARSYAIGHGECRTDKQICLIATADINQSLRQMLAQTALHSHSELLPAPVTAFVFADESVADRFDEYGCLIPEKWLETSIDIGNSQIIVADRPEQQARAVAGVIDNLNSVYRSDEVVIAVPQPDLEPFIDRTLSRHNLRTRMVRGTSLMASPVIRLLESVAGFLNTLRFEHFAALIRHPAIHDRILADVHTEDFLTEVDKFQNLNFPTSVEPLLNGDLLDYTADVESERSSERSDHVDEMLVREVFASLRRLIEPLSAQPKPLQEWCGPIQQFLETMYGERVFDRTTPCDKVDLQAIQRISDCFAEFDRIPASLMPTVNCPSAVRTLLQQLKSEFVMPVPDPDAIQAIGWLDLPLDDAPVAIVTGFNDGIIPSAESADLFLPNTVRENLNLLNNSRRFARDAYALSAILKSRAEVTLIAGRRDAQKNPLAPSRLMFATDEETIARRAHSFFSQEFEDVDKVDIESESVSSDPVSTLHIQPGFFVPKPIPGKIRIDKLSPTAFQNYLRCPYRFYLQRVLRSGDRAIEDRCQEMDAGDFGTVLHDVLERFGTSEWKDTTDVQSIRRILNEYLDDITAKRFRFPVRPVVKLQIENMRMRLDRFAAEQAAWRKQGWRIEYCETDELNYMMDVDGTPFHIFGRIDRIDIHEQSGEMFVFDYKTSASGSTPEKTHIQKNRWVNLQLPMYRHLVKQLPGGQNCRLGYIVLPPSLDDIRFAPAEWSDEELESADEVARNVIRDLRNGVFWPPTDPPPSFSEEFANICMDNIFDRPSFSACDEVMETAGS